ncbi:hypothetical protein ACH5RR_033982 [Cinchona calisaya]|uniref:Uncharacterized protein n=1 Tax=Cinchona calisaya TaxID=153742 RepID=A0ABD2Y9J6_9GENT
MVGIDWKTGIAAKAWESVARKEKIEVLELKLRKREGFVEAIPKNLIYLKSRRKTLEDQLAQILVEDKGCSNKITNELAIEPQEANYAITDLLIEEISFDSEHLDRKLRIYSALPSILKTNLLQLQYEF